MYCIYTSAVPVSCSTDLLCGMRAYSNVWYLEFVALHADPEKIVKGGGYWNSTLVGETEEQSGQKPRTVIVKLKV